MIFTTLPPGVLEIIGSYKYLVTRGAFAAERKRFERVKSEIASFWQVVVERLPESDRKSVFFGLTEEELSFNRRDFQDCSELVKYRSQKIKLLEFRVVWVLQGLPQEVSLSSPGEPAHRLAEYTKQVKVADIAVTKPCGVPMEKGKCLLFLPSHGSDYSLSAIYLSVEKLRSIVEGELFSRTIRAGKSVTRYLFHAQQEKRARETRIYPIDNIPFQKAVESRVKELEASRSRSA